MFNHHMPGAAPAQWRRAAVRRATIGILTTLVAVVAGAFGASPAGAANQSVSVVDFDFVQRVVAVQPGESVTWTHAMGLESHNVHFDDESFRDPVPPLSGDWIRTRTFPLAPPTPGEYPAAYRYHCDVHGGYGGVGMAGIVYVNATGTVPQNVAPMASFFVTPPVVGISGGVIFQAQASSDSDGFVVRYEWDLDGDGSYETDTGRQPTTSRSYPTAGTRTVGLRVTDDRGLTAVTTRPVQVTGPLAAAFTASPSMAQAGQTVSFDGSASTNPGGFVSKYQWDLDGDGTFETDTGAVPTTSHAYASAATLAIALRVFDSLGQSATTTRTLQVDAPPPPPAVPPAPPPPPPPPAATRLGSSVAYGARASKRYTVLRALSVRRALAGSQVRLRCTGKRCPLRTRTRTVRANAAKLDLTSLVRGKRLPVGTTLEIRVTRPGTIGIVRRLRIRSGRSPKSISLCLAPGATKPTACAG